MKKASAIRYDNRLPAPFLVAKGRGRIADLIEKIAAEYGIPISREAVAAEVLDAVEVGDFIPEELYETVAEILVFLEGLEEST
jgi:flagellar biosynthesis protein